MFLLIFIFVFVKLADSIGLDLTFMLNSLIQFDLINALKRETEHQIEVIKRRCEVSYVLQ